MGIAITVLDADGLRARLPLAPNLNHAETAFGGSIATAGIVACWALAYALTREAGLSAKVIVQHSTVEFLRPIVADSEIVCPRPHPDAWSSLTAAFARRGTGRIDLRAQVLCAGQIAAEYMGIYVAQSGAHSSAAPRP